MDNEILTQRLDSILSLLESSAKTAGNFAAEQAPEVIQQLLQWKFTISLIIFCVGIFLIIASLVATYKIFFYYKEKNKGSYDEGAEFFSLSILFGVLVGAILLSNSIDWLQIWIAPKLYLLEYASSLLK